MLSTRSMLRTRGLLVHLALHLPRRLQEERHGTHLVDRRLAHQTPAFDAGISNA